MVGRRPARTGRRPVPCSAACCRRDRVRGDLDNPRDTSRDPLTGVIGLSCVGAMVGGTADAANQRPETVTSRRRIITVTPPLRGVHRRAAAALWRRSVRSTEVWLQQWQPPHSTCHSSDPLCTATGRAPAHTRRQHTRAMYNSDPTAARTWQTTNTPGALPHLNYAPNSRAPLLLLSSASIAVLPQHTDDDNTTSTGKIGAPRAATAPHRPMR
jgi:hypothetical protein